MKRKLTLIPALAVLICLLAGSLYGEMLRQRVPRGNKLGWGIICNWAGPMYTGSSGGNTIQFPAGSGNLIYTDAGLCAYAITRDTNGDGMPNDSLIPPDGGVGIVPLHASIINYDEVMQIAANEPSLGILGNIPYTRVWSSLDLSELADWPAEGRWGRSISGDPKLHGAETMFVHFGDVATTYGYGPPAGVYSGYSFYFLDYGENNDMIYVNVLMQNVSEYLQYSSSAAYGALGKAYPDGYKFHGMMIYPYIRQVGFGGYNRGNAGWAYHPEKELIAWWCQDPTISSFNPQEPPMFGVKVLRAPEHNGEVAQIMNVHTDLRAEFGVTGGDGLARSNLSVGKRYQGMTGKPVGFFEGQTNPFTGRPMNFYPGLLESTDTRYSQWLWGDGASDGGVQATIIAHWGELHDIEPRDTLSIDYVVMFAYPGVQPLVRPNFDLANIDDPMMQDALAPLENTARVATDVFAGGLVSPETPVAPPLTIVPGDRQVTITWSDLNLRTPDSFYYVLQEKGWDPDGNYREYDFEGYRLYRSFVGPNDSHSELIWEGSLSANNLSFYYVDKMEDDRPYYRMRNGLKVWYALVPYDRNYSPSTGEMFSLPDLSSSKTWNRPGENGIYQVLPRSEASNYKPSSIEGVEFMPAGGTADPIFATTYDISGDGSGKLTEAPVYLAPVVDFELTSILAEKITAARTLTIETSDVIVNRTSDTWGSRKFEMKDGSHAVESPAFTIRRRVMSSLASYEFLGPNDSEGSLYGLSADWQYMSNGDFRTNLVNKIDQGAYSGGTVAIYTTNATYGAGYAPNYAGHIRAGRYTLTWQSSASGLTLAVMDVTRNKALNFVEFPDDYGWGFVTLSNFGTGWSGRGTLFDDMRTGKARADRTVKMLSGLPSDNTAEFAIWVNGQMWSVRGGGAITMPSTGTVFTLDNAWGSWNSDKTVFTQWPDPPVPGDKWQVSILPTTINASDADFSKIRVVPNPYMASSFLDNSPNHKRIEFVNLPAKCTIRIYSLGGNLVNVLNHVGANRLGWGDYTNWDRLTLSEPEEYSGFDNHGGTEPWNLRNRYGQLVASGLYFYHVTDERGETFTGKFYVVN